MGNLLSNIFSLALPGVSYACHQAMGARCLSSEGQSQKEQGTSQREWVPQNFGHDWLSLEGPEDLPQGWVKTGVRQQCPTAKSRARVE